MRLFAAHFFKNFGSDDDFIHENNNVLFERLKLVSKMLIFTYPCFFIVDFFLLNKLNHPTYKLVMAVVHLSGLAFSVIFLLLYHSKARQQKGAVINSYIFLYLLIGAVSSINSQLYNGNMYVYIIILFSVAVIFVSKEYFLLKNG